MCWRPDADACTLAQRRVFAERESVMVDCARLEADDWVHGIVIGRGDMMIRSLCVFD